MRPDDRAEVEALRAEARREVADVRGGAALIGRDRTRDDIDAVVDAALSEATDALALVGTLDEMVVGHLVAHWADTVAGGRVATILALWVTPLAREIGVGEALIDEAFAWATGSGCVAFDADALPGDRATKNFFETHGLVARGIRVSRTLGD